MDLGKSSGYGGLIGLDVPLIAWLLVFRARFTASTFYDAK